MTTLLHSAARLAALVGLLSALLLAGLATPAQAALARPTGLQLTTSGSPMLEWRRVAGATSYKVEVAETSTGKVLVSATTTNRRYVPTRRVAAMQGDLTWRVQAVAGSKRSAFSAVRKPSPANPSPVLRSPADGATLPQPSDPPLLQWNSVPAAEEYIVEVSRDANFVQPVKYTTQTTALLVPKPQANAEYWWRVTADLGSGLRSQASTPRSYVVGRLGEVTSTMVDDWDDPTPDRAVEDVVFDWDPVPGAVTYELWVSSDPDFNKTGATVERRTGITGTRYSPVETYDNDQYYWKVRAVNERGETVEWPDVNAETFKREWLLEPELVAPRNAHPVGNPLSYEWKPVEHASRYELQVGSDPNFSPGTYASCPTGGTTFTPTLSACAPKAGVTSYWRVRGIDAPTGVKGLWSDIGSFVYRSDRVTQHAPLEGDRVAVPTLRWAATPQAYEYVVTVLDDRGRKAASTSTYALSWTPTLSAGTYTWNVRYRNRADHESPEFPGITFSVGGAVPLSERPALTPLTGTAEDPGSPRFPSLSWEPLADAAYYKVNIGEHGNEMFFHPTYDAFLRREFTYPAATDTGEAFLTPGKYDWSVTAYDASDRALGTGATATFEITPLSSVSGHRVALTGTVLDNGPGCTARLDNLHGPTICSNVPSTPVLEWDAVPDAGIYLVYVSRDRELSNLVYPKPHYVTTMNTRWTPTTPLPDSQAGTPYHWVIRPCVTVNVCAPDPTSKKDSAGHAFDKRSPAPQHLTVAEPRNDITFTWQDYLASNLASRYEVTGEPGNQAAKYYRVEVATNRSFTSASLVDTRVVDQPTYTAFTTTYPEGPLYWRVQAIDDAGNGLSWSQTAALEKNSGWPSITEPGNGTKVAGTTPLRWGWTDFAADYTVEVYANGDITASPANRVLSVKTPQAAYAWTKPFPVSQRPYVWRVRRNDAKGRPGTWPMNSSGKPTWHSFYSNGATPTPQSPTRGFVSGTESLFRWTAIPAASRYRFELRPLNGSVSSTTTAYPAWAPVKALKDGTYDWRAVALDASKGALGTSAWTRFTVDGTAPKVTTTAPASRATVTSSFQVKFSERVSGVTSRTLMVTRKGSTKALPARVSVSRDGKSAVVKTTAKLQKRHSYTVRVSGSIRDAAGNALAAKAWTVTVG